MPKGEVKSDANQFYQRIGTRAKAIKRFEMETGVLVDPGAGRGERTKDFVFPFWRTRGLNAAST